MTSQPRFRRLRRAGTAASGVVVLALLAGGLIAAEEWQAPAGEELDARGVAVAPGDVTMVCPGPPRLATEAAGEDLGYDEFDPEGSGTQSRLDAVSLSRAEDRAGEAWLASDGGEEAALTAVGEERRGAIAPLVDSGALRAAPAGEVTALVAGTTAALTEDGDLRGLAAARCLLPDTSAAFVAGSTETGDSAQLVLTNLGATAATVTLEAWGATGPVDTSALGSVLVAPHSQQVVLLEAAAPGQSRLALQLRATGGEVAAHLQISHLDGLTPGGTDLLTPESPAAAEQVLPGVAWGEGAGEGSTLRLFNPGEEVLEASVELLGDSEVVAVPGAESVAVDPGTVADVSLAGLPAGEWAVRVRANDPVAAAALIERGNDGAGRDRMWIAATPALARATYVLPQELAEAATLHLANPGDSAASARIRVITSDGGSDLREVEVGAERTATIAFSDLVDVLEVDAEGEGIHSGVVLTAGGGELSTWLAPTPDPHEVRAVNLAPRAPGLG